MRHSSTIEQLVDRWVGQLMAMRGTTKTWKRITGRTGKVMLKLLEVQNSFNRYKDTQSNLVYNSKGKPI